MYATMWSVAGIREAGHIVGACGLASLLQIAGMLMLEMKVPRSYYVLSFLACVPVRACEVVLSDIDQVTLPGNIKKKAAGC